MPEIKVRQSSGKTEKVALDSLDITVLELKEILCQKLEACTDSSRLRLIFAGHILKDHEKLEKYKIADGHVLHLVVRQAPPSATGNASPSSSSSTSTPAAGGNAPPPGQSPFGMLGGGAGGMPMGMFGMPNQQQLQTFQQQMMNNPQMLQAALNNPMVQNMLNDPAMLEQMISRDPNLQRMMREHPEMRQAMSDPEMMRQVMAAMRNPDLMNQFAAQTDRQMANISAMPGGMNHLHQMYTNVAEPMMNAMQAPAVPDEERELTPQEEDGTAPLPNPWAPNTSGAQQQQQQGAAGSQATAQQQQQQFQAMMAMLGGPAANGANAPNGTTPAAPGSAPVNPMQFMTPAMMQAMQDPATQQAMMQFAQQAGMMPAGAIGAGVNPFMTGGFGGAGNGAFGGVNAAAGASPAAAPSTVPPEERFANQLVRLGEMGFTDRDSALQALIQCNGNINAAIERLLGS